MYLNKKFKKSKIFLKKCFKYHLGGASFKFIDTSLKNDKEVILSALKTYGYAYRDIPKK